MCGVKQSDPRLPSQFATGKTRNQSRNLYSPAVAGYTDEKSMVPYFEESVASFAEIGKKGFCTVDDVEYPIHIRCSVVADMAFLHKYLGRGGELLTIFHCASYHLGSLFHVMVFLGFVFCVPSIFIIWLALFLSSLVFLLCSRKSQVLLCP